LKDAPEGYEHFNTPFILTINEVLACIRNTQYRYMIDETTLFPEEVFHYDEWVMREALNDAIAHQDYSKSSRIIVLEYNDHLIFDNAGSFIPE
jgi:ATP-dependent DNA helicase RecG